MEKFTIKTEGFRKLEDPRGRKGKDKYIAYVKVDNVPKDIPMTTNPREQNLGRTIPKKIRESLISNDGDFHNKNRGLVFSAHSVKYDNTKKEMTLFFKDEYEHGNIDGGHTYKIILENQGKGLNQFVQFEIMIGVEDIIEPLASARNTSAQVDDRSLAELEDKFDPIKEAIEGMSFYDRIAFKQNQQLAPRITMIDAREVVAIISMFDNLNYSDESHPTFTYSSKAKSLDRYLSDTEHFRKFTNIGIDIFDLYNHIELDLPEAYNAFGGRYGSKKYSGYKEGVKVGESKFNREDLTYRVPDGLMYPIVASFRALVEFDKDTQKYRWIKDPIDVYELKREDLASKLLKFTDSIGQNPNAVGKDGTIWDVLYMTIEREVYKK